MDNTNTKFTQIRGRTKTPDSKPKYNYNNRSPSHHRFFLDKKYYSNGYKPYHIELEEDERNFLREQGWGSSQF